MVSSASERALGSGTLGNANDGAIRGLRSAETNLADATSTSAGQTRANALGVGRASDGANGGIRDVGCETATSFRTEWSSILAETTSDKLGGSKVALQNGANRGLWANNAGAGGLISKGREEAVRSSPSTGTLAASDDGSISADIINKVALANTALNGGSFIRVGGSEDSSFSVDANLVDGASAVARNGGRGVDEARVTGVTRWAHALEGRDGSREVSNALAEVASTRAARLDAKASVGGVVAGSALGAHTALVGNVTRRADASETKSSGIDSSSGSGNANGVGVLGTASVHARSEVRGRSTTS